jgi:hypothetical protein
MILSIHQPQYLPWVGYFHKIDKSDCFVFLDTVQYKHREFQNRNKIRTKDGEMWLTVPVLSSGRSRQRINEVLIDNTSDWQQQHWQTLTCYYTRAAFFSEHSEFFADVYRRPWERLVDLNVHIIQYFLKVLAIATKIHFESALRTENQGTDRVIELCQKLGATTYLSGQGGKDYLEEDKFAKAGITLQYQDFRHPAYQQLSWNEGESFISQLSLIDLLFNEGPRSRAILRGE